MTSLAQAIAPPLELQLSDGNTYRISRIGINHLAEWEDRLNLIEGRKKGTPVTFTESMDKAQSVSAMRWFIWRAMKDHDAKLTEAKVGELVGGLEQLAELFQLIFPQMDSEEHPTEPG
jgi:hypothetical protein